MAREGLALVSFEGIGGVGLIEALVEAVVVGGMGRDMGLVLTTMFEERGGMREELLGGEMNASINSPNCMVAILYFSDSGGKTSITARSTDSLEFIIIDSAISRSTFDLSSPSFRTPEMRFDWSFVQVGALNFLC